MIILAAILGAFLNRWRGGLLNILFSPEQEKTSLKRIGKFGNAIGFGLLAGYVASSYYAIVVGIAAMLIGASFGWGKYISGIINKDFDANEEEIKWIDKLVMKTNDYAQLRSVAALSLRGLIWTVCIAIPMAFFNLAYLYFIPVGLLMGVVYYVTISIAGAKGWGYGEYAFGGLLWGLFASIN